MIQRNEANLHKNWQKELANVVTCPKVLLEMVGLSSQVHENDIKARSLFPVRVPLPFIKKFVTAMQMILYCCKLCLAIKNF
jgi:L-lysine 2,3-aminomutase